MHVQREGRGPQQARIAGMLQGSATLVAGSRCFTVADGGMGGRGRTGKLPTRAWCSVVVLSSNHPA